MRKILTILLCICAVSAWAATRMVTPAESVQAAINTAQPGDTIYLSAGTYHEALTLRDGVSVVSREKAILDGTGLHARLITIPAVCTHPTTISGLTLCHADHRGEGGGAYLMRGVSMHDCLIYDCNTTDAAGAIMNYGGEIDHCRICGNQGSHAAICNYTGGRISYCLVHNNTDSVPDWPNSGGIYNPEGSVTYCTIACNEGAQYAGLHSEGEAAYNILWNNRYEEGFTDPSNFIDESVAWPESGHNAANDGFFEPNFVRWLDTLNYSATGPQFVAPTPFVGRPKTRAQQRAMLEADFRLLPTSPCFEPAQQPDEVSPVLGAKRLCMLETYAMRASAIEPKMRLTEGDVAPLLISFAPHGVTYKQYACTSSRPEVAFVENSQVKALAPGKTTLRIRLPHGKGCTVRVEVLPRPVVKQHALVSAADSILPEHYTTPSYMRFRVAREAARRDSSAARLEALREATAALVDCRMPYNVVATVYGDPRHEMAFTWFTNATTTDGTVQISLTPEMDHPLAFDAVSTPTGPLRYAVSTSGLIKAANIRPAHSFEYTSHKAVATGLTAGYTYYYRVGRPGAWSEVRTFRTAPSGKEPFQCLLMSDSHLQNTEFIQSATRCAEAAARDQHDAAFMLFPGDFVETGSRQNSEWEWEQWFDMAERPLLQKMPCVPTDGNHDDSENLNFTWHFLTDSSFCETAHTRPQFAGVNYSFVYGDALFLVYSHQDYWRGDYRYDTTSLSTSAYLHDDIVPWMRRQISKHPECRWRIALVHQNLFCGSGHQADEEAAIYRDVMLPAFADMHIDVCLQGHDHTYEVMGPIDNLSRTVVPGSITGRRTGPVDSVANLTGYTGGQYDVTRGTLYFVGATCGSKRYTPHTREQMETDYPVHRVRDYYDLFTGRFGQPGAPTYSVLTIASDSIDVKSYIVSPDTESIPLEHFTIVKDHE